MRRPDTAGKPGARAGRVREVPLERLRPWPENPRTISGRRLEDLKRSLSQDPGMLWARPLVALPDGTVIMGNQRLLAATELGWKTIPVITAGLTWEQARVWALRDNNQFGVWDEPALAELLAELASEGVDLALTGFSGGDLDAILAGIEVPADPDEAPDVPDAPMSRPGEIYELGSHRLLCGDATDADSIARLLGGSRPGVVWTDPPYGVGYVGKTARKLTIANDSSEAHAVFAAAIAAADPLLAPSSPFYVCVPGGGSVRNFV